MIAKVKELQFIPICLFVSDIFNKELMSSSFRFRKNSKPEFANAEVTAILSLCYAIEQRFKG